MRSLIIAPHPDDEILGAGGTLIRKKKEGSQIAWILMTDMTSEGGWSIDRIQSREAEIEIISKRLGFDYVVRLGHPAAGLHSVPMSELVKQISNVFDKFKPDEVLLPHPSDVHSDHKITYQAAISASKWFRSGSIRTLLAYETLSETGVDPITTSNFSPNYFVNIETELEAKIEAARIYSSELAEFPFPRSVEAIEAQARIRGAMAGFKAAEAFQLLKHVF